MKINKFLLVYFHNRLVGTLALTKDNRVAFEYDDDWLDNGFSISPFSLPLKKTVFIPEKLHFSGLFGVFADSLPDAWGNVLVDRVLRKNGIDLGKISVLDRLAIVGSSGMGALTYEPEIDMDKRIIAINYDMLANECKKILNSEYSEELDTLYQLGGTSGGARPKIMTEVDGEPWIIKFPAHVDPKDIGQMEYDYSLCAKKCGINMPETRLFPSKECKGYFGVKRFDRDGSKRKHMLTAAALLELNFEEPSLDYHSLMKLTKIITKDNTSDIEEMYRRMCFNVFAHNRDDHSKNITYIYNEEKNLWRLSPAYDLTYSNTYYGEHTTTVNGNGVNPTEDDLIKVGMDAGMTRIRCVELMERVRNCVGDMLEEYLR
ncbi:MAG: type II toxin-antitoxin system HipA family toxin [Lachnospiraceae bacterium]|nr:type II toxin-antitoxin system HipA family toxin [Lachnospiraceae bacterium]